MAVERKSEGLGWERELQTITRLCGGTEPRVKLNNNMYGCLLFAPIGVNWNTAITYTYWTFEFKVNQNMAVLQVKDSFAAVTNRPATIVSPYNGQIGVFVILQSSTSFIRTYYDAVTNPADPLLFASNTIIADVSTGTITGLAWDANCNICGTGGDICMQNSYNFEGVRTSPPGSTDGCYLPKSTCDNDGSVDCDINIFISMYGTDVDGKYLQSANARQSTFMAYDNSATNWLPSR